MPVIDTPPIDGAFTLSVTVRFDSLGYGSGQTVFDSGDAASADNIILSQAGTGGTMEFIVFVDGVRHAIAADDVIVLGETALWTVTVDADGVMSLEKDGAVVAQGQGDVPADVTRPSTLLGESNTDAYAALTGEVSAVVFEAQDILASDPITGTEDADVMTGGVGADTILALGGDDSVTGGAGNGSLVGGMATIRCVGVTETTRSKASMAMTKSTLVQGLTTSLAATAMI